MIKYLANCYQNRLFVVLLVPINKMLTQLQLALCKYN